jgi:hypothetical protein
MKPLRCSIGVFFLISVLSFSAHALLPIGTWDTQPPTPDFAAGTWKEIFSGGEEGQPDNEITAQSPGYFIFKGAILEKVEPGTHVCQGGTPYKTTYKGGTLTLITNHINSPWYINIFANPHVIKLDVTIVDTCKYDDGTMSFTLESDTLLQFPYEVKIEANYGIPKPLKPKRVDNSYMYDDLASAKITINGPAPAAVDIKPGSCPNPINVKSRGVIPMAILGGPGFDVRAINASTIVLGVLDESQNLKTVQPIRIAIEDVGTPYNPLLPKDDRLDCNQLYGDRITDLTLKFDTQKVVEAFDLLNEEDRSTQEWFLMFNLNDGKVMVGSDIVWILNKTNNGNNGPSANRLKRNIR